MVTSQLVPLSDSLPEVINLVWRSLFIRLPRLIERRCSQTEGGMIELFITRSHTLIADGQMVERYPGEAAAAAMAVRFAQDNGALYSIDYERRAA